MTEIETDEQRLERFELGAYEPNGDDVAWLIDRARLTAAVERLGAICGAAIVRIPSPTDEELLGYIADAEGDSDSAVAKDPNILANNLVLLPRDIFKSMAAHARRSVKARAAEGEVEAAANALHAAKGRRDWRGPYLPLSEQGATVRRLYFDDAAAALAAARLWRDAHPGPVVIDEAMKARGLAELTRQDFSNKYDDGWNIEEILAAALTKEG